jgi:CubicO group peptidase (beta-lactamase class C family)
MPLRRPAAVVALAALLPAVAAAQATAAALPPGFDAFVDSVLTAFRVPGAAVAVVRDGRTVLAKGYGVREVGTPAPVDSATLFGIASNTKLMTATALAMLVEEGKLEWDAPVQRWLPWFSLSDPWVSSQLTVRDLLVHRSGLGLGAGDLLWWPGTTYTRREIAERLRHLPLATSFRSAYAYDNVLYLVAGEVIKAVTGQEWEEFVTARVLRASGMAGAWPRHAAPAGATNVARTHAPVEGTVRVVPPLASDNTNPAGGVMAGAADMAAWLRVQLDSGKAGDGTRLWKPATTRQLWSLVTPIPVGEPILELRPTRSSFAGYGLGVILRDWRGQKLVTHDGGLPGYVSRVAMLPDRRTGVAVLTNAESTPALLAITGKLLDHALGASDVDWMRAATQLDLRSRNAIAATVRSTAAARDSASRPARPLAAYAGTYRDAWYGDVTVAEERGRLVLRMTRTPSMVGDLSHWQYDSFLVRWRDRSLRADAFASFVLAPDGTVSEARMTPASPEVDFSFDFQDLRLVRVPAAALP